MIHKGGPRRRSPIFWLPESKGVVRSLFTVVTKTEEGKFFFFCRVLPFFVSLVGGPRSEQRFTGLYGFVSFTVNHVD